MGKASLAYGRGKIINAAALYNTLALDGVWLDFRDLMDVRRDIIRQNYGFQRTFCYTSRSD